MDLDDDELRETKRMNGTAKEELTEDCTEGDDKDKTTTL